MKKLVCRLGTVAWVICVSASQCLADDDLAERSARVVRGDVLKLFNIGATIVECVGAVLLLWACFELGTGMQAREARDTLKGYKLLAASIVLLLVRVIYKMLTE